MIDWLATLISPILGAGTGTIFSKILSRKPRLSSREKTSPSTRNVSEQVEDLESWRGQAESRLTAVERDLRRLRADVRAVRVLVDVFLVLGIVAAVLVFWWRQG